MSPILCVCLNPVIQKTLVFSRLVPGEVNRSAVHRVDASGKGVNVTRVLVESGRRAVHLTQAGGVNRSWFLAMCETDGLEVVAVESGSEIRFCFTVVDEGAGQVTELVEEANPVSPGTGARLLEVFDTLLPACCAVTISGTKAAGFEAGLVPEMARRARQAGKLLVLDVKGADLLASLEHRPIVVKPNLSEFLATWPLRSGLAASQAVRAHAAAVAAELFALHGTHLVLTRGANPTWYWDGSALAEEPVEARRARNPTGSGDSFTAGLVAVLAERLAPAGAGGGQPGRPDPMAAAEVIRDAVRLGTRYGGLNAERLKPGSIS